MWWPSRSRPVNALTATTSGLIALVSQEQEQAEDLGKCELCKTDCAAPPAAGGGGEKPPGPLPQSRGFVSVTIYTKGKSQLETGSYSYHEQVLEQEQEQQELDLCLGNRRHTKVRWRQAQGRK